MKRIRWLSRKFLITIGTLILFTVLRIYNFLNDQWFIIGYLVVFVSYNFIEGALDLRNISHIKSGQNEIEMKK